MNLQLMTFAKWNLIDWWEGCVGAVGDAKSPSILTLEEEGMYTRVCNYMYRTGEPLSADWREGSQVMRVNHNLYRKVIASLIEKGKLIDAQGYLINERVMDEIFRYRARKVHQSETAKTREADKKWGSLRKKNVDATQKTTPPVISIHPPSHFNPPPQSFQFTPPVNANSPPQSIDITPPVENRETPVKQRQSGLFEDHENQTPASTRAREEERKERKESPLSPPEQKRSKLTKDVEVPPHVAEAFDAWNEFARANGCAVVAVRTPNRVFRLERRLAAIGGIDAFRLALTAIPDDRFLMGKVTPGQGQTAFKLDLEKLLATENRMGDVLAKLIDHASAPKVRIGPNGRVWGWWREIKGVLPDSWWRKAIAEARPNGEWPWWILGPHYGHPESIMPEHIAREGCFIGKYNLDGLAVEMAHA